MAPVIAEVAEHLNGLAGTLRALPHGQKSAMLRRHAEQMGVSPQTLHKWLKETTLRNPRKRRSDAGQTSLSKDDAMAISGLLMESHRRNDKRLLTIENAVEIARSNGLARAEVIDSGSGEIRLLSTSAVNRALRAYRLHPDQLLSPAPAMSLASLHPNHVWQIDASLCVLYYLRSTAQRAGLQVMEHKEFYKNKPANLERIENERVWRYVVTDHTSGHIYVEYVLGAESGENLANIFINATQKRPDEPVHGVPLIVMLDPGSANTGALFRNLCRSLQVRVIINQVGNPRAKGQVEQANNQVERSFESGLKFVNVDSLDQLNVLAAKWRRHFNGESVMARHGRTRYEAWLRISAEQLRIAPETAICRELATTKAEERTVTDKLQVSFRGRTYDVSIIPQVQNGDKLMVCRNPWRPEGAQVVTVDADGRDVFYVIEPVAKDANGFDVGAPVIGDSHARHADTPAMRNAKAIEKMLMGEETLEGAAAARKGKRLAFDGKVDPWKHMEAGLANAPAYLPKRGTALVTPLPGVVAAADSLNVPPAMRVEEAPLSVIQAAGRLRPLVREWGAEHYQALARDYPQGIMESELPAIAAQFNGQPRLAAVGGASG